MDEVWAVDVIALNFSRDLTLTECTMAFRKIRLKWRHINNSNSWFLAILNGFSEGLFLFELILFSFLKIKKYLNKNQYFMCQLLTSES